MISTTSWGSLVARDELVAKTCGEAWPKHILQIAARLLYQIRMTSNSITAVDV